jgi:lipopolysaccharide transport system permease protein
VNFPREAILLAGAAEVVFNFFIRCLVLLPIFAWEGFLPPASVFMAPLGVAALLGAGIAVGVLLAPLGVLYSDVEQGIATITPLWMLLTPVFYAVPPGALGEVMVRFNPVAPLLDTARAWCLTGTPDHLTGFLWCSLGVALLLALGWVAYRLALPVLAERMGE